MMSGDDTNPIFFNNNKKKIGRPEHSLPPPPPPHPHTSDNISFMPYPLLPSKWTSYVYHP